MKLVSWALGIWAEITFVLCVIYGLVTPLALHGMQSFLGPKSGRATRGDA